MAKHALSLFTKIALFAVVMLCVAKVIPYDGLVGSLTGLFDFQSASKVTGYILGEPDLEVWESLRDYFSILINILISIPILSAIIIAYSAITRKVDHSRFTKEWALSTLRRFAKVFGFILLFWVLLRFLPYQSFIPNSNTYSTFITAAFASFNLLLTIACYWFITKKITKKRSL